MGFLGALVGQNEADVGFITDHRGDAGIHIHIVTDGNIVVAVRGHRHIALTEQGIDEAVHIGAVVVVLLDNQVGGIHMVHPLGHIVHLVVGALAADGIHQHGADNVRTAEQTDGAADTRAHPVGIALLIDLKSRLIKEVGGIVETQIAVEIASEMLRRGVANTVLQPVDFHILGHHVDDQIGGQAVGTVIEPLDDVAVAQGRHTDGAALVVDLGIVVGHFKLRYHVCQLAQLAVAQLLGAGAVQHGDLVKADLLHFGGKVALFHRQQVTVIRSAEYLPRNNGAHQCHSQQTYRQEKGHPALLFHKFEIALGSRPLKAGGDDGAHTVHHGQQHKEGVKLRRFEVDRRQRHIIVDGGKQQRHRQIDGRACCRCADGLTLLLGAVRFACKGILPRKALKIGVIPINVHR